MEEDNSLAFDLTRERLQSAWLHVRENAGCAGVDGVAVDSFDEQAPSAIPELHKQALSGDYRALPLRKLVIGKSQDQAKTRTLLVPTVRDRVLQTAVATCLSRSYEEEFFDASFGYRPHRGVDRAIARIIQLRDQGFLWVVDADIQSYFDSVSHQSLLHLLERDESSIPFLPLLRQWIECICWDGHELRRVRRGIPQGAPISPVLANLFLTPVDRVLEEGNSHLIRYADDFLLLCRSESAAEKTCRDAALLFRQHGLELSREKTRVTSFSQGFTFLGVSFRGGEVFTPWKYREPRGRVVFIARTMPQRALRQYRKEARPRAAAKSPPTVIPVPKGPAVQQPLKGNNDLPFLYIAEQGAILRKSGDRFLVEAEQSIRLDVPYHRLENILLFGNIQVTTQAIGEALDKGIALGFFTRHGRLRGSLVPPGDHNVGLRITQYQLYLDEGRSLQLARAIIDAKIRNGLAVLDRYEERGKGAAKEAKRVMEQSLDALPTAAGRAEVDGLEGIAARNYFDALMQFNESAFEWPGRVKHPATDPLNVLLSLAYTLLMNEISALLEARGLDPAIGTLHELDPSRPSLALDLMEPFRAPLADRFVLTSVNRSVFQPADFAPTDDHGSVALHPAALHRFFEHYERWMQENIGPQGEPSVTFRTSLRREVESFCRSLRSDAVFAPFRFPLPPSQTSAHGTVQIP